MINCPIFQSPSLLSVSNAKIPLHPAILFPIPVPCMVIINPRALTSRISIDISWLLLTCQHLLHQVLQFSSVQSLSRVWLFATPWIAARQASLSITNTKYLTGIISFDNHNPPMKEILFIIHSAGQETEVQMDESLPKELESKWQSRKLNTKYKAEICLSDFIKTFYFILEYSQLTILW